MDEWRSIKEVFSKRQHWVRRLQPAWQAGGTKDTASLLTYHPSRLKPAHPVL